MHPYSKQAQARSYPATLMEPLPWLKDESGQPVDETGRRFPTGSDGRPVNDLGQAIDRLGRLLDKYGNLISDRVGLNPLSDTDVQTEFTAMLGKFEIEPIGTSIRQPFEDLLVFKANVSGLTDQLPNGDHTDTNNSYNFDTKLAQTRGDHTRDLISALKKPFAGGPDPLSQIHEKDLSECIGMQVDIHKERLAALKPKYPQFEKEVVDEEKAALNIQRLFKGHIARKKYEKTKKQLEQEEELRKSEEASKRRQMEYEERLARTREEEERLRREEAERLRKIYEDKKLSKEEDELRRKQEEEATQREAEEEAALKIQRIFKGHAARQEVDRMREDEERKRKSEELENERREEEERRQHYLRNQKKEREIGKIEDFELKSNIKIKKQYDSNWGKAGILSKAISAFKTKAAK